MILKSLRLKNFRKFKDSLIEFPDGVTGVVGLNGAGKSTIFEAIAWVLYGAVAARTSADQIKSENADHKDTCRVELGFIFGDDSYRVVREMSGKSMVISASATVNGKLAADGAEIVSRFIQKKLGMDFKSFFTSIFAKQKELNALSSMNPSERRPLILRMLGISALDEIIAEIHSDIRGKKDIIEKLELDLADEKGEKKVEKFKNEIKESGKKKEGVAEIIKQIQKNMLAIEKRSSLYKKECDGNKIEYEKICKSKEQLDEKKILFDKKKRLIEEIKNLELKIEKRQENIKEEEKKLKKFENLEQELKLLEKRRFENNGQLETVLKKIEQKKIMVGRIRDDVEELKTKKGSVEKIGPSAKCPTCERILGEQYNKLVETYGNEIAEKNNKIVSLQEESKKVEIEYDRLSKERQALQKKNSYLQGKWVEKEKINTTVHDLSKEVEKEEKDLENKKNELSKIITIKFDEKEYLTVKEKVDTCYKNYQISLDALNEIRTKLEKLKLDQEKKEGEKNLVVQHIKNLEQKIEAQHGIIKKIKIESKNLQHIKMLDEIMSSFRTYLISQIRPTLSLYASELFDQLTNGKYSEIELDENYNLIVFDNGAPYNIERFSGGEEDLANLCIRLAISEVITEKAGSIFNFIILDEIFGSQDNIRKQNIIKALSRFSSKFRQIFLITHVEEIKNFMENAITVSEEENGESKIRIE
ncbi:MAG: SMC family ATPase [Thermoplasmatales archaeon]|nr:MAG: SMC family ATPase [Thermoplasmatales archaeon]